MSKLVDFFSGSNTPKYSVRKDRVPVEEKEDEKPETTSEEYSKVQTVYTAPPPQPEDKGENNLEEEDGVDNSGAAQKKATPPRDNTKSVFQTGNEVGFDKALDNEDGAGATATNTEDETAIKTEDEKTEANDNAKAGYTNMRSIIDRLMDLGDNEASELSEEDKKKFEKAAKRRMLMSGIADATNAFHKAYSYARGVKPMNDGSYSDKAKKEIRDDWEWMNKKNDRALNYYARAAELEKTIETLKNKEALMEWRTARLQSDIDKATDKSELEWKKLEIDEAYKNGLLTIKQYELLDKQVRTKIAQQNADTAQAREQRMSQGTETIEETTDELGDKKVVHKTNKPLGSQSAGSTSNGGKKPLPTAKKQLP